mgnify:CR=1 FL=1
MDKTNKTKNLAYCALFTALIAVGAFIRVPVPVVPFTLQYLFTMLAGLLLGPRLGTIAVGTYVLLGLVGLPIFTQGGGFWYVFQPSFGYLIGFCVGTFVTGWLAKSVTWIPYVNQLTVLVISPFLVVGAILLSIIASTISLRRYLRA